jgi:HAD superfamily hydrolase (TIGR01549 family)
MLHQQPAFLFDLDGTLADSVYQHVLAWREALEAEKIELSVWRIHRKIGMSGGLFTNMLLRETGLRIDPERVHRLQQLHAQAYKRQVGSIRPLPGAREILTHLTSIGVKWAIATSGRMETAKPTIATLGLEPDRTIVITRDQVQYAKPDPDLFLAAAKQLGSDIEASSVIGDSVWDMLAARRARALGVGLSSAVTAARNWNVRARTGSTRTRLISLITSMRLACAIDPLHNRRSRVAPSAGLPRLSSAVTDRSS